MPNFIVVVDTDAERRTQFSDKIQSRVAVVDGLQWGSCSQGDCCVLWAAAPDAPVSQVADNRGAAVLFGEAIPGAGPERIDAAGLRDRWQAFAEDPPEAYDGFYAGVVFDFRQRIIVGADLLGLFPVYYCLVGGALLVGASPELFCHHPAFRMELDPAGLVGLLLTNGLVGGQTLLKGVQRLSPGHVLVWRAGERPREVRQYEIPVSDRYSNLSLRTHVDILDEALRDAIRRHAPRGRDYGLMLSGGLDSRLLGGYLAGNRIAAAALTLGVHEDIEMQCAISVARTLGFPHRSFEPAPETYAAGAQLQANYEHLASGFSQVRLWSLPSTLRELSTRVVSGFVLDRIVMTRADDESPLSPFEKALRWQDPFGLGAEILGKLLHREVFGDLVQEILAQLRREYANAASSDFRRGWQFELWHRARFHVGSAAHRLSFGSWPVLPALDRRVLEVAAGMPAASVEGRRLEMELLADRFPELASLPLDRGSYDTLPIKPRFRHLLLRRLAWPFRRVLRSARKGKIERRYWQRTSDFNAPGWVAIRRIAEADRKRVYTLFRQDTLDSIVPVADVVAGGSSGVRLLLGTMLWAKNHL